MPGKTTPNLGAIPAFADWGGDYFSRAVISAAATALMHNTGCKSQPNYLNYFIVMTAGLANAGAIASSFNCLNFDTITLLFAVLLSAVQP